jgi:manganese efflux pump family protein
MSLIEVFILALSLAADAFAISVCAGATGVTRGTRSMIRLSFHFGLFQFLMPILGWMAGLTIETYVETFDHWIAFILLTWVAVRMIKTTKDEDGPLLKNDPSRGRYLVILSVATSIDALAVGISLALVKVSIWYPAFIIGVITGITSFLGILLGKKFSESLGRKAAVAGGILLILIGIRIILTHTMGF